MLLATGPFSDDDLGVACYHAKTGAVELYLNHLIDGPGEYVVVDCTAGAESFASGMFTRFDLTVLVAEPTRKSVGVCRQWTQYAAGYDVAVTVVGNKVASQQDVAYLREHAGDDLLTWLGHEPAVRAMEQGRPLSLADLAPDTITALAKVQAAAGARDRTGPGTPVRPPNSTSRTPAPGRTPPPEPTWPARSTPASSSGRTHSPRRELIARYRCSVEILLAAALVSACTSASIHDW